MVSLCEGEESQDIGSIRSFRIGEWYMDLAVIYKINAQSESIASLEITVFTIYGHKPGNFTV